jgi:hypothetical protein
VHHGITQVQLGIRCSSMLLELKSGWHSHCMGFKVPYSPVIKVNLKLVWLEMKCRWGVHVTFQSCICMFKNANIYSLSQTTGTTEHWTPEKRYDAIVYGSMRKSETYFFKHTILIRGAFYINKTNVYYYKRYFPCKTCFNKLLFHYSKKHFTQFYDMFNHFVLVAEYTHMVSFPSWINLKYFLILLVHSFARNSFLRKESRFRVFEKSVLKRIFGPMR